MEPWRTAITTSDDRHVWVRGYDLTDLMRNTTFADLIFLLQKGRLPDAKERHIVDAILVATADHGPASPSAAAARMVASGNRQSLEAAMAAGILAIGDSHGGAGLATMELIARGLDLARRDALSLQDITNQLVREAIVHGDRLPGFGHVSHSEDPRAKTLLDIVKELDLALEGVAFVTALAEAIREQIGPLPINIDGAIGAVLYDLRFPPTFGKAIFIMGRTAGLAAQVLEEYTREQPRRIRIPAIYDGPPTQKMVIPNDPISH